MPAQVPISSIISTSKFVRDSSRCASSSLPAVAQLGESLGELVANDLDGALERRPLGDEVLRRIDRRALERGDRLAGQRR